MGSGSQKIVHNDVIFWEIEFSFEVCYKFFNKKTSCKEFVMVHMWPRIFSIMALICVCATMPLTHADAQTADSNPIITLDTARTTPTQRHFIVEFTTVQDSVDNDEFVIESACADAHIANITLTDNPRVYSVAVATSAECLAVALHYAVANPNESVALPAESAVTPFEADLLAPVQHTVAQSSSPRSGGIDAGSSPSIGLRSDGIPVITTVDSVTGHIRLITCNTTACTAPVIRILAKTQRIIGTSSLVLNSGNLARVTYYDSVQGDFRLIRCANLACDRWSTHQIDASADAGFDSQIHVTSADHPVITYSDASAALKLAICSTANCSTKVIRTLVPAANRPTNPALILTAANIPIVSFYDKTDANLRVVLCNNSVCSAPIVRTLDATGDVGNWSSIALSTTGLPVISYFDATNNALKMARCTVADCRYSELRTHYRMGSSYTGSPMTATNIAVLSTNIPVISFYNNARRDLMLVTCNNANCLTPFISTVATGGDTGDTHALALNSAGVPVIAFHDSLNETLKLSPGLRVVDRGQPSIHHKTSPANDSYVSSTTATLTWDGVANASSYVYCFSSLANDCTDSSDWQDVGLANNVTQSGLTHNTKYYWHIGAVNQAGRTLADNGAVWHFTVSIPPVAFSKTTPSSTATAVPLTPVLSWAASTRATSYEYCFATTVTGCTRWVSTGTARTVTLPALSRNTTYYWGIRARNAGGVTIANGTVWQFTTIR